MKHKLIHAQKALQKLALNYKMQHSIRLLAMSTMDLNSDIDKAVEENPFLEKKLNDFRPDSYKFQGSSSVDIDPLDSRIPQQENPRERLLSQLKMLGLQPKAMEIAEYLIYEMDDNGYIKTDVQEAEEKLCVDRHQIEKTIKAIQSLEPAGIGARNLAECLRLQLEKKGKQKSLEYAIVTNYIKELARNDIARIGQALRVDIERVKGAIAAIKKLNPRPLANLLSKEANPVTPDLIAEIKNKKIKLRLNKDWLPQLEFYNPYKNEKSVSQSQEANKFIKTKMDVAKTFIDNVKRREETIYKVAHYIIDTQTEKLVTEERHLNSLTINEVAGALSMHPSTISRAVSNKYIQIDGKVVPLKSLLSKGVQKNNGELIAITTIKKKIEQLVKREDKTKPLCDEEIKRILQKEGIMIERRTVAKYRNAMRILPTHLRKKIYPPK